MTTSRSARQDRAHSGPPLTGILTGSFTPPRGEGEGIAFIDTAAEPRILPLRTPRPLRSPSFLAVRAHERGLRVLAVEAGADRLTLLHIDDPRDGAACILDDAPTGSSPTHVAWSDDGSFAIVAAYGDGTITAVGVDGDTLLPTAPQGAPAVAADDGGAVQSRAHAALILSPSVILTTDIGRDLVHEWHRDTAGVRWRRSLRLPAGCGPRHLAVHTSGSILVVCEYAPTIFVLHHSPRTGPELVATAPAVAGAPQAGDAGAGIAIAPDGRTTWTGTRGSDRLTAHSVTEDGRRLRALSDRGSGGSWPRHHTVAGGLLVVANERSHDVSAFRADGAGDPVRAVWTVRTPSPAFVLPL